MKHPRRVHRMTKHFRPRSKSWKTGHIITLSLIGFAWYTLVSKRSTLEEKSSLTRHLQGLKKSISDRTFYDNGKSIEVRQQLLREEKKIVNPMERRKRQEKEDRPKAGLTDVSENHPQIQDGGDRQRNDDRQKAGLGDVSQDRPQIQGGGDDPFQRKSLYDNRELKLAEREPVEAMGRRTRPKLGGHMTAPPVHQRAPIILVWKAMEYQMKNYKEHLEFYFPGECGGCQVTTNRSLIKECSALVHFNSPDLRKFMDVPDPSTRNPDQLYVFWSRETPAKTQHFRNVLSDPRFDPIFNLTMNFRGDADIVDYFGNVEYELRFFKEKESHNGWFEKMMSRKSGLAMWAVSNCNSTYGAAARMKYAISLIEAGLNLTAFGSCFGKRYNGADLMQELMRHKFYMSLENSLHCPDYVSEKFWRNGLRAGSVPIVWGPTREDVSKIAPANSYIHSEDFEAPEKLIEYLNYLDKNDTAYREYHAWRFTPIDESIPKEDITPTHRSTLCRLCKTVTSRPLVRKTIPSVTEWLYRTRYVDDLCFK